MRKTALVDKGFETNVATTTRKAPLIEEGVGLLLKENPFRGNSHSMERKSF
jgi:hypothetical protein